MRPIGDFMARIETQGRIAKDALCQECDDLGWVSIPDGGVGAARLCDCQHPGRNPENLRRYLALSGMQEVDIRSALAPWDETHQRQPKTLPWARAAATRAGVTETPIVLYSTKNGVGKTKLAAMMLAEYLRAGGQGGIWCSLPDTIQRVMAEKKEGPSPTERRLLSAKFIVFEELLDQKAATEAQLKALELWIFTHHSRCTPMVITTNIDFSVPVPICGLSNHVLSRIRGGRPIRMGDGVRDYRPRRNG